MRAAILEAAAAATGLGGWAATLVGGARRGKADGVRLLGVCRLILPALSTQ